MCDVWKYITSQEVIAIHRPEYTTLQSNIVIAQFGEFMEIFLVYGTYSALWPPPLKAGAFPPPNNRFFVCSPVRVQPHFSVHD